ncbi:hypothetical protein EV361DRAFT_869548 [Lentinula raphanica]|nr:hypothetical protein EV361DRAFT_869548 [Lentinula raphanica]
MCATQGSPSVAHGSGRVLQKPTRPETRLTPEPETPGAGYPTSPGVGFLIVGLASGRGCHLSHAVNKWSKRYSIMGPGLSDRVLLKSLESKKTLACVTLNTSWHCHRFKKVPACASSVGQYFQSAYII